MTVPPYAKALVSLNGGARQSGLVTVVAGDIVQLVPESVAGWNQSPLWELYDYPPGFSAPVGWSTDSNGSIFSTLVVPPSFAWPAYSSTTWGKTAIRLRVNGNLRSAIRADGTIDPTFNTNLTDEAGTILNVLSNQNVESLALFEKLWVPAWQRALRGVHNILAGVFPYPLIALTANRSELATTASAKIVFDIEPKRSTDAVEFSLADISLPDHGSADLFAIAMVRDDATGDSWRAQIEGTYQRTGVATPVAVDTQPALGNERCSGALKSGTHPSIRLAGISSGRVQLYGTGVSGKTLDWSGSLQGILSLSKLPQISSFSPTSVPLAGAAITITGFNFAAGIKISIDNGAFVDVTTFTDANHITHNFAAHGAATVNVVVKNLDGLISNTATIAYAAAPAPTVSSTTPATISSGGISAQINGANFVSAPTASIDGVTYTATTFTDANTLTWTFPAHAIGSVTLYVKNPDGQIGTATITYAAADFDPTAFGSAGDLTFYSRGNLFHLDGNGNVDDTTNVASSPVDSFKNAGAITAHPAKNATGSANSKPSMTFDGVNDTLFTGVAAFSNYMATTDFTILAVLRYPTWPTNDSATSYLNKPGVSVAGGYTTIGARNKGGSTPVLVGGAYVAGDKYCETPSGQVAANTPFLATLTLHGGTLSIAAGMNAVGPSGSVACGAISGAGSSAIALGANYAGADFANYEVMCLIIYKNGNIAGLATLKQGITDFYQLAGHS